MLYLYVYLCTHESVCICTGVMGKCQACACLSLLSLSFYPPSHHAGPSSQTGLSHVYTASRPLFHLLFVLLLHTSSSIKLSPLSCTEQEEGALPHYSNMPLNKFSPLLMILPILVVSYISYCIPDPLAVYVGAACHVQGGQEKAGLRVVMDGPGKYFQYYGCTNKL